jgi:hypothetical protein
MFYSSAIESGVETPRTHLVTDTVKCKMCVRDRGMRKEKEMSHPNMARCYPQQRCNKPKEIFLFVRDLNQQNNRTHVETS